MAFLKGLMIRFSKSCSSLIDQKLNYGRISQLVVGSNKSSGSLSSDRWHRPFKYPGYFSSDLWHRPPDCRKISASIVGGDLNFIRFGPKNEFSLVRVAAAGVCVAGAVSYFVYYNTTFQSRNKQTRRLDDEDRALLYELKELRLEMKEILNLYKKMLAKERGGGAGDNSG